MAEETEVAADYVQAQASVNINVVDTKLSDRDAEAGAMRSHWCRHWSQFLSTRSRLAGVVISRRNSEAVGHGRWRQHDQNTEDEQFASVWLLLVARWRDCRVSRQLPFGKFCIVNSLRFFIIKNSIH